LGFWFLLEQEFWAKLRCGMWIKCSVLGLKSIAFAPVSLCLQHFVDILFETNLFCFCFFSQSDKESEISEGTVASTTNTIATSADSTDPEAPNSNASTLTEKVKCIKVQPIFLLPLQNISAIAHTLSEDRLCTGILLDNSEIRNSERIITRNACSYKGKRQFKDVRVFW